MVQLAELQKIEDILDSGVKPKGVTSFASLEAQKSQIEKRIGNRTLRYYKRIREKYSNAVVSVSRGFCPVCGMQIPLLIQQEMRRGTGMHSCGTCGRILLFERTK